MARKESEIVFLLNAQLGGSYRSAFTSAQGSIGNLQTKLNELNKQNSNISSYQRQQKAIEATEKKLEALSAKHDNIQKEIDETGKFNSALANKEIDAQLQIDRTTEKLNAQKEALDKTKKGLEDAGVNTNRLADEQRRLTAEADNVASGFGGEAAEASAAFGLIQKAAAGLTVGAIFMAVKNYLTNCVEASIEFESAMIGVAKTTDMSRAQFEAMSQAVMQLSTQIPVTTTELAGIGETAGQLGIAREDLVDFSTVMAQIGTATNMASDEAATMLAQFANITQMPTDQYDELGSTIVALGNEFATTEQKITDMSQGIAAAASLAGMSEADMTGLSAAVTSLGMETQMGSTAMSKLIADISTAIETGENLEIFARSAGQSAEDFKKAWGTNAAGALTKFVTGLSDTERNGKSATLVLKELGITETRMQRMVLSLANSGNLMTNAISDANKAWEENTALATEAEKRYGTTESKITMMENSFNNLNVVIGDIFSPLVGDVCDHLADMANAMVDDYNSIVRLSDAAEAAWAIGEAFEDADDAMAKTIGTSEAAAGGAETLIDRLDELTAEYGDAAPAQEEYKIVLEQLTELVPDLAQYIDATTGRLTVSTDALRANTQAWADNIRQQAMLDMVKTKEQALADVQTEVITNTVKRRMEEYTLSQQQKRHSEIIARMNQLTQIGAREAEERSKATGMMTENTAASSREYQELQRELEGVSDEMSLTQNNINSYNAAIDDGSRKMDEYGRELDITKGVVNDMTQEQTYLGQAFSDSVATADVARGAANSLGSTITNDVTPAIEQLSEAYTKAYEKALASIEGQFDLWEEAPEVAATSLKNWNKAILSQAEYWAEYNTNLQALAGIDIPGLSEMLGELSDGSTKSVNAVAGLAKALSDKDTKSIETLVKSWQTLQDEQGGVSDTVAKVETDYNEKLRELVSDTETAVADMELSAEAAASAKKTMDGFIDGAEGKLDAIKEAYRKIAQAAIKAIDDEIAASDYGNAAPSGGTPSGGNNTPSGNTPGAVVNSFSLGATPAPTGGGTILNFSPVYHIEGTQDANGVRDVLGEHSAQLRVMVEQALEEINYDAARRRFA